jgi:hypothetical protein
MACPVRRRGAPPCVGNSEQVNYRERNNLPEPGVLSCVEAALSVGMHEMLHIGPHGELSEVSQGQLVAGIQGICSEFRNSVLRCDP